MATQQFDSASYASQRAALRKRIKRFYRTFNQKDWEQCFAHIDPRIRENSKILRAAYVASLEAFKQRYGTINIVHIRINLYLDVVNNKHDDRPFAYVYVFWQDDKKAFHVFRERWVKDAGRWYTRVVGLVTHKETT
jgi:hypothetical protein